MEEQVGPKEELERKVMAAVSEFKKKTGVTVKTIYFDLLETMDAGKTSKYIIGNIRMEMK